MTDRARGARWNEAHEAGRVFVLTLPVVMWVASVLTWRVWPDGVLGPHDRPAVDMDGTTGALPWEWSGWSLGTEPHDDASLYPTWVAVGVPVVLIACTVLALLSFIRRDKRWWAPVTATVAFVGFALA